MGEGPRLKRARVVGASLETWGPTALGEETEKPTQGKGGDTAVEHGVGAVGVSDSMLCGGHQACTIGRKENECRDLESMPAEPDREFDLVPS